MRDHRVLIVDASTEDRRVVATVFRERFSVPKHHIHQARNAREAIAILKNEGRFHWLFVEPKLPDMCGFELLRQSEEWITEPRCHRIVMSGRRDREALITAAGLGVSDYIVKPFQSSRVIEKIRRLAYGHERRNAERVQVIEHYNVVIQFGDLAPYHGRLMDISVGGCQVMAPPFDHGGFVFDDASLLVVGPCGKIELPATLLRAEAEHGMEEPTVRVGFRFHGLEGERFAQLADYLAALKKERERQELQQAVL